ncbi:MAG: hypothetical protein QXJ62_04880 [Nitrososphaeria archaeon]
MDTISKERKYTILLLLTLPILLGLMSGELIFGIIGIVGIIIAILVALFFNGIDKEIISDRDKVYPKINEEIKKKNSLNTIPRLKKKK